MAVKHFMVEDKIICGTKGKSPELAGRVDAITCKRCLKKLDAMENGTLTKKVPKKKIPKNATRRKKPSMVEYINDRKWGHCLELAGGTLVKFGDELEDKVNIIVLIAATGMMSTSMRFANVLQILKVKEANFLRGWFINHKMHNGGRVLVSEVREAFTKKG